MSGDDPAASPNVLLLVLDTVSARHTSLHGYHHETTPGLARLADDSTVYTQAHAGSNWSLPSHATLFTGLPAGVHRLTMDETLVDGVTVFESLARDGYATGVFSENPWLTSHPSGFAHAFETVVGVDGAGDAGDAPAVGDTDAPTDTTTPDGYWFAEQFLEWVDEQSGPWAACLNLMDAHFPYHLRDAHDEFGGPVAWSVHDGLTRRWEWEVYGGDLSVGVARLLESLYESAIRQADAVAEGVWEELVAAGVADDTLLVVTSDHGECFGAPPPQATEPLALEHGLGTHEDLFHVPLLVKAPRQREGRRVESLASHTGFPAAVDRARWGETEDTGWFVSPEGQATAYQPPLHAALVDRARESCRDPHRYRHDATVVYRDTAGDAVTKRAAYGGNGYETTVRWTRRCADPRPVPAVDVEHEAARVDADTTGRYAGGEMEGDDPSPMTRPLGDDGDTSILARETVDADAVKSRLADLGYL